ncbi:uncharacterized protein [Pleurodeles waltl]|uniref:uncharacterized protein isoform X2 n=1 Tax=Pleurodeles waltl TaxID=8319 RepID=UPI0037099F2C
MWRNRWGGEGMFQSERKMMTGVRTADSEMRLEKTSAAPDAAMITVSDANRRLTAGRNWKTAEVSVIGQMVPRLHLGMIELWLEFRRLQEDKESMWKRMNAMLSRSLSACQEVATEMSRMKSDMSSRFTQVEGVISGLISKVGNLEVNRPQDPYVAKFGDPHTPFRTAVNSRKGDSGLRNGESGSRRGNPASSRSAIAAPSHPPNNAICPARILHRVSNLTQILNGHTNLLVELYERVSSLEDMGRPTEGKGPWIPVLPEGSGEGN